MLPLGSPALAQDAHLPRLYTNEQYVADVSTPSGLDVSDLRSVLAYVLGQLPDRVKVVPTENYYYFYFYLGGVKYAGNFRFDIEQRDKGLVEFVYFKDTNEWLEDDEDHHATLSAADGVALVEVGRLSYALTFGGRTVTFDLNDLGDVRPPEGALAPDEEFLGPVADKSGMRFFLVFDSAMKQFRYVLDESAPADELVPAEGMQRILLGRRTGFAFFRDTARDRKLLVGVFGPNVDVNNYFDGPFDQLPDNFLKGDTLRRALLAVDAGPRSRRRSPRHLLRRRDTRADRAVPWRPRRLPNWRKQKPAPSRPAKRRSTSASLRSPTEGAEDYRLIR